MSEKDTDVEVEPPNKVDKLSAFLNAHFWKVLAVSIAGFGVLEWQNMLPGVPRWFKIFGLTCVLGGALAYVPVSKVVEWLFNPNYTYLVVLDSRYAPFAVWEMPPKLWAELDVVYGELYQLEASVPAWTARQYEPDDNEALGTWRGSASDMELVAERERIDEIRTTLETEAKRGLSIRIKQSGIVRAAVIDIAEALVKGFEEETLYKGEAVDDAVEKALDRWELDGSDNEKQKDDVNDEESSPEVAAEDIDVNGAKVTET